MRGTGIVWTTMAEEPTLEAFMRHLQVCVEELEPSLTVLNGSNGCGNSRRPCKRPSFTKTGWKNSNATASTRFDWSKRSHRSPNLQRPKRWKPCSLVTITAKHARPFLNRIYLLSCLRSRAVSGSLLFFKFPLLDDFKDHRVVFIDLVEVFTGYFIGQEKRWSRLGKSCGRRRWRGPCQFPES